VSELCGYPTPPRGWFIFEPLKTRTLSRTPATRPQAAFRDLGVEKNLPKNSCWCMFRTEFVAERRPEA